MMMRKAIPESTNFPSGGDIWTGPCTYSKKTMNFIDLYAAFNARDADAVTIDVLGDQREVAEADGTDAGELTDAIVNAVEEADSGIVFISGIAHVERE